MAKLHFYYSAMNAGKSSHLLQAAYNYSERHIPTKIFIPQVVADYIGAPQILSRIGLKAPATPFDSSFNFLSHIQEFFFDSALSCVMIDEAQFLTADQVWQLSDVVDLLDIPVLAYGLRTDFQGNVFEGSKTLLALADVLAELKTICFCGSKAIMNLRFNEKMTPIYEGTQVCVGGNDKYVALCRPHFKAILKGELSLPGVLEKIFV